MSVAGSFGISSIRSKSALRIYCSNIGPIVSGGNSLLKMLCISFTMNVFSSGRSKLKSSMFKPSGRCKIAGIEIDDIVEARRRNKTKRVLNEIAMRINDRDALARDDVFMNQIAEKRRFTGTRLTDNIHVPSAVIVRNIYRLELAAENALADAAIPPSADFPAARLLSI